MKRAPPIRPPLEPARHLVEMTCTGRYGGNLGGEVLLDDRAVGKAYATNLTPASEPC